MPIPDQNKTIIDGCIKGRSEAWEKFVQRFSGLVMWSIRERLARSAYPFVNSDVEDIHQETFLSIYRDNKLRQLKNISSIATWVSIIAGNIAINYMQRIKGRLPGESTSLFEEISPGLTIADTLESKKPACDEQIDSKIVKNLLTSIIKSLKPKEKIILNLYFVYENTIEEISKTLDLPEGSVASIIKRAKERIKKYLED